LFLAIRFRVIENRVVRNIFRHKKKKVTRNWKNCILRSFMICTPLSA
jgi:hypothetical protein